MRIHTLYIYLIFLSSVSSSQNDTSITAKDFNKDGFIDTLKTGYDGGSNFGGKYAFMVVGNSKDVYYLDTYGSFSDIKRVVAIPKTLNLPNNEALLNEMLDNIFPEYKEKPEGSLQWIINSFNNHANITDNEYFDLIINPQLKWEVDKIELPYMYYTNLDEKTLKLIIDPDNEHSKTDSLNGFIIYYGHNHYRFKEEVKDSLLELGKSEKYKIYRTSHGVLVKKGEKHKWVFVTDLNITGAPGKLRWESVGKVFLRNDHLIIKQNFPVYGYSQIYLVNIENGLCGRLKKETVAKTNCLFDKNYVNLLIEELNSYKD